MDTSYLANENFEIDPQQLSNLSERIKELRNIREDIESLEKKLKDLKNIESKISSEEIPEHLSKFGIDSIKLEDGQEVSIKEDIHVTLPKTNPVKREKMLEWISAHGGGGIIKDNLIVQDPTEDIIDYTKDKNFSFERKKDIHSQTLKAFFREIIGMKKNSIQKVDLDEIPPEANFYIYKKTNIKGV